MLTYLLTARYNSRFLVVYKYLDPLNPNTDPVRSLIFLPLKETVNFVAFKALYRRTLSRYRHDIICTRTTLLNWQFWNRRMWSYKIRWFRTLFLNRFHTMFVDERRDWRVPFQTWFGLFFLFESTLGTNHNFCTVFNKKAYTKNKDRYFWTYLFSILNRSSSRFLYRRLKCPTLTHFFVI